MGSTKLFAISRLQYAATTGLPGKGSVFIHPLMPIAIGVGVG